MIRALLPILLLLAAAGAASAEDLNPTARAKAAGNAAKIGSGSSVFTTGKIEETVTPYAGTDLPEASIPGAKLESRGREEAISGSESSKVYQKMQSSSQLRPTYELDGSYGGLKAADAAIKNADAIAGQYFSGSETDNPACDFTDFSVMESFTRYCDSHTAMTSKDCTITRTVEVDRRDYWQCDIARSDLTVTCVPNAKGECRKADLPEGNPNNQCTFLEERCVEWEDSVEREPPTGALFEITRYHWIGYGLMWNKEYRTTGRWVLSETLEDGWTYHRKCSDDDRSCLAVWRTRPKPGGGKCLKKERDYRCISGDQCKSLRATPACKVDRQKCITSGPKGCELQRFDYSCFNDLKNHKPARLVETKIERIEDKLTNSCNPSPADQGCAAEGTVCTSGPKIRTVMGFPVSRDCWTYKQSFQCLNGKSPNATDCGPFLKDPSCKKVSQTCLTFAEADEEVGTTPKTCQHWEYGYECGGGMSLPDSCSATNVCVGDLCEGIPDEVNKDFPMAASWLTVLDEAAKDSEKSLDMQDVKLFGGVNRKCKVGALGYMNCCKDSGWANGILDSCSESELALIDRIQAKAAVYVGTYCSRKVLGVCVSKRRSYCTFNSQLATVFQKEIHRLTGTSWGSAKRPNCNGLKLDEIETIDWDKIDLSEAFGDMMNEATVPASKDVKKYMRDRFDAMAGAAAGGP
ncbi:conjugal transfer protein TraN (plasmid) [Cereibacter azotoformans]|uniref:conjugal transfer protein TraN n=1 Tax=Cereibacter azotoformans TaxID=43057 RepID=UPI003B20E41C